MNKGKTKLRVIQILCILSLIITVFSIQRTYARYFEKVDTRYETDIKRWVIKVDGTKIHDLGKDELSEVMQPQFRVNTHMNNNNTLVPGREGYFEFLIDYSEVDLAFRFEFDIEQLNTKIVDIGGTETEVNNFLEDFEIYGYSIVENGVETKTNLAVVNNLAGLTQVINPTTDTDANKTMQLRILFRWNDGNADTTDADNVAGMNNYEDTQYAGMTITGDKEHTNLNYKIKTTFTQVIQ